MWTYNGATEAGRGCWRGDVCTGTATYQMFIERTQQWFCSEEQFEEQRALGASPPEGWNLVPLPERNWEEYEEACAVDADCPRPDLGQLCGHWYWDATEDGTNYSNGHTCYNWPEPPCPGADFSARNYNFDNTGFSYQWQISCTSGQVSLNEESSASSLAVAAATLLATLSMF